jgi:hypothetical protein
MHLKGIIICLKFAGANTEILNLGNDLNFNTKKVCHKR